MLKILNKIILISVLFSTIFVSCSKEDDITNPEVEPEETETEYTVNRENQYALNVVYFKPSDYTVTPTILGNVSEMMLYIQKWYEKQMDLQGYGKKTFGLMTKNGTVKIILIEGPEPSSYYDKDSKITDLVNKYFDANPEDKQSEHTLVLGQKGSGVPFHGSGKWCFATSQSNFDLMYTGKYIGDLELVASDQLGGIMHELGHGLNLPHNCHKASDLPNVALMSFGNHTYEGGEENLVYLTKASCAILNTSQTFNTKDKLYYDTDLSANVKSYTVTKDDSKNATIIEGVISSNLQLTDFIVGHDGIPSGGNDAYDKITWSNHLLPTENAGEYSFYAEMPYSDIFNGYKRKDTLSLTLDVIADNGQKSTTIQYLYTVNGTTMVPNNDILRGYTAHVYTDHSGWTATANSKSPASHVAYENIIDENNSTYWHSKYPYSISTDGNHIVTVDMGDEKQINGIYWLSWRSSGSQFRPKHGYIETSTDGTVWDRKKEFSIDSMDNAKEVTTNLDSPVTARYFRLVVDQVYAEKAEENLLISELDII